MTNIETQMDVRNSISDLVEMIDTTLEGQDRIDAIDYAIKMLNDLKSE